MLGTRVGANKNIAEVRTCGGVTSEANEIVQIGLLLEWDSTQSWTTALGIIDTFPNRPFNVVDPNPANAPLSIANHQEIAIVVFLHSSYTISVIALLRSSPTRLYTSASSLFTISLTSTGFNKWKTMNKRDKKTENVSQKISKVEAPSTISITPTEMISHNYYPNLRTSARDTWVESRWQNSKSSCSITIYVQFKAQHTAQAQQRETLQQGRHRRWPRKRFSSWLTQM